MKANVMKTTDNKEVTALSADTAEGIIIETVTLLNKSMNLLDVEPENPSARFNIHHGFRQDIKNCQDIIRYNLNVPKNRMKILNDLLSSCDQRRIAYCLKYRDN